METKRVLLVVSILVLVAAGLVSAARNKIVDEAVPAGDAKEAVVNVDFGVGKLIITPKDMADMANFHCEYDPSDLDVAIDQNIKGSTMYLDAKSDFDDDGHIRGHVTNDWDVTLSTRYPTEIEMNIGAAEAEIDLGGVPLRELSMDISAAKGTVDFSQPNPERMDELRIEAGASSVNLLHVGNANFKHFKFEGGAGSFDLDLRGRYTGESEVDIEIGVSSADITLPEDIPVRIESTDDNWFSSVDFKGGNLDEVDDGIWESPDFRKATTRLIIHVEVGMGSADFRWKA